MSKKNIIGFGRQEDPIEEQPIEKWDIVDDFLDQVVKHFAPAASFSEADVYLSSKELVAKFNNIVTLYPEQELKFYQLLKENGFITDLISGDGGFTIFWIFKSR